MRRKVAVGVCIECGPLQRLLICLKRYRRRVLRLEASLGLLAAMLCLPVSAVQVQFPANGPAIQNDSPFPIPSELVDAVSFWRQVFGVWSRNQAILHDEMRLGLIYAVIPVPGSVPYAWSSAQMAYVNQQRRQLQARLRALEQAVRSHRSLSDEQLQLYRQISASSAGRDALLGAAERVRFQQGMRERFQSGLKTSGRYQTWFKKIFKEARLPVELSVIPHIESSFQMQAVSPVGAAGIWQLMPETGRTLLQMNEVVDERRDPILAARGAARYLQDAYRTLRDWGLAVTAYNHGVEGMLRAREEFGPNIGQIAREYRSRSFGFASRNFYPEFLAVLQIIENLKTYFPEGVTLQPAWSHQRVPIASAALLSEIASLYQIDKGQLLEINPALTEDAIYERRVLPAGLELWMPHAIALRAAKLAGINRTGQR